MKTRTLKCMAAALIPVALLALTGCGTTPANPLATQPGPTLAGGMIVVKTSGEKAVVASLAASQRTLALRSSAGTTTTYKVAPEVADFAQLQAGDKVKATVTDASAIFLLKNGPPPSAGAGVTVAGQPSSVVLLTTDARAKVATVDRSYRLFKVEYADGSKKEFKVPLPDTLLGVQKGDEVIVRTTEPLAICLKSK
jgi:hypothetical protein